jgi:competence ComEA-like helix-hairpin-helix protein
MRALFMLLTIVALAAIPAAAQQSSPKTEKPPAAAKAAKSLPAAVAVVNLNTATQAQLETLPGIGAKVAERILDYRQKNGQFKKIEEILETSRSCPSLLTISRLSAHRTISRNR